MQDELAAKRRQQAKDRIVKGFLLRLDRVTECALLARNNAEENPAQDALDTVYCLTKDDPQLRFFCLTQLASLMLA